MQVSIFIVGINNGMPTKMNTFIISDPTVMMGKPLIKGTRITVELILEKLAAGETVQQILIEHPQLTEESVRAAIGFAKEALRSDVVYPTSEVTP